MENERKYPIRVLHRGMSYNKGGIETFIMNLYRNIDKTKVQFDFLVPEGMNIAFEDEIIAMGGRIYKVICGIRNNPIKGLFYDRQFFRHHPEISVLHVHDCSAANLRLMKTARKMGIKTRILHSHNNDYLVRLNKRQLWIEKRNKRHLDKIATHLFACSKEAGEFMFDEKSFTVVRNAIEPRTFMFSQYKRERLRKELGIDKQIVVGCVARLDYQKNHLFLLDVFAEYNRLVSNSILLLIGEGNLYQEVHNKICELGLDRNVLMLGMRDDVPDLLNCMDVFVLPSLSEGLGIVFIEAQINGLPCLASDNVPKESNILGKIEYKSLSDSTENWARSIVKLTQGTKREVDLAEIQDKGYDMYYESKKIEDFYLNCREKGV